MCSNLYFMKKKVMALVMASAMAVSLTACGGGGQTADTTAAQGETTAAQAETTAAPAGDSSQAEAPAGDGGSLVYWSMWEATEPQGQAIQAAVDKFTADTGVAVDLQFKGRTGIREGLQPALDAGTNIDMFDEDIDRVNTTWGQYLMDLEDLVKGADYEATANAGLMVLRQFPLHGRSWTQPALRLRRQVTPPSPVMMLTLPVCSDITCQDW